MERKRKSLEKAVWQFCLDHSQIHKKGTVVTFLFKDRKQLFRRIVAREYNYVRLPEEKYEQWIADYWAHKVVDDKKATLLDELNRKGPFYIKLLFRIKSWITIYLARRVGFKGKYW